LQLLLKRIAGSYHWSDGLEVLQSLLLGYTDDEIAEWLQRRHKRQVGDVGITVYLIMSDSQRANIRRLGDRCLDPSDVGTPMLLLYPNDTYIPKADLVNKMPDGMHISRMAITFPVLQLAFSNATTNGGLSTTELTESIAIAINRGIVDGLQFQYGDVWKRSAESL
jgi:hypothetical protein